MDKSGRLFDDPATITYDERLVRHDYWPFGEKLFVGMGNVSIRTTGMGYANGGTNDGIRKKFTGYERDDETGLDYAQARYYSSKQGRFTSPDEFTGGPDELYDFADVASDNPTFYADLTDPQSLNKYQYCYNDPLSTIDPDGHKGLRERLKEAVQVAADFAVGVAQGVGASVSYGLCQVCNPSSNDSTAQRVGQWVGTGYVAVEGTATAIKGTAVIVTTGGTTTPIVAPLAVGGAVVAGGALKNANALINTPISKSQSSQVQDFSPKTKKEIDARDGNACQSCGREVRPVQNKKGEATPADQRQRHHIKPKKDGGDGSAENGTTLCPSCHKEEHRKLREAKKVKIENTN